ncbi:hypothetical protein SLS64_007818 [Diaporthe eres]|uniref:SulP family inorganic anion transporter n=1 Tax=Diaporthe eres TaxID=83184 RepID=A0ABR1P6A4_DIAER
MSSSGAAARRDHRHVPAAVSADHRSTTYATFRILGTAGPPGRLRPHAGADVHASIVVFLVALPLCAGVTMAPGVHVELGLVTGIIGAILIGSLPGSSLQVSGPAASVTVLV